MALDIQLRRVVAKRKKRVGRGYGSGKSKTSGRGHKGQRNRSHVRPGFEGGQTRFVQRLPFIRGKSFNGTGSVGLVVSLAVLEQLFDEGATVSKSTLVDKGVLMYERESVKILANGELKKKLTIEGIATSVAAKEAIEKAGGSVA